MKYRIVDVSKKRKEPLFPEDTKIGFIQELIGEKDGSNRYEVRRQVVKSKKKVKLHSHPFTETYFVLNGSGTLRVSGKKSEMKKGVCAFVNSNTPHALIADKGKDLDVISIISCEEDREIKWIEK